MERFGRCVNAEIGRDPVSKHQIQPGCRQNSRACLAEPNNEVELVTSKVGTVTTAQLKPKLLRVVTTNAWTQYALITAERAKTYFFK